MGRKWDDRVAEYVDSPNMVHRLRVGTTATARIYGSLGTYKVQIDTRRKGGQCTCPSEIQPCKHVEALRLTWKKRPKSFADVDDLLKKAVRGKTRDDLVDLMRSMALASPPSLAALGAVQFEERDRWDEDDPDEDLEE